MPDASFRIEERYQGFPGLALGGITGGRLAGRVGPEAAVSLHRPIRTGTDLAVVEGDDAVELHDGDELAASASAATVDLEVPDPVSYEAAEAAADAYLGHHEHPYPACFTCGTDRPAGDGLRLFAGPVGAAAPLLAAPWTPHPNHADADGVVPLEYVWAAVDCPSIWAVMEAAPRDSPEHVVTGRLAVRVDRPVRADEPHVLLAWPFERASRRWPAGAAVLDADGRTCAVAEHTLVVTDWGVPLGVARPADR